MAYAELICRVCELKFKQEKRFTEHMSSAHGITADESYYCSVNGAPPTCSCGCQTKLTWRGWKLGYPTSYVRGHNASDDTVFRSKAHELAKKRRENYRSGKNRAWNAGLTRRSSEKLDQIYDRVSTTLKQRYESGDLIPWQEKRDPSESFKKISETKKKLAAEGLLTPWNAGLTKETDDRIAYVSQKIRQSYATNGRFAGRRIRPSEFESRFSIALNVFEPLVDWNKFYRVKLDRFEVRCRTCREVSTKTLYMLETCPVCHICNPVSSKPQLEIFDYVSSFGFKPVLGDRSKVPGYELDVHVEDMGLAIELNGLYWHDENHRGRTYHADKTATCMEAGIRIIHVFSDEWQFKRPIVESIIKHSLGRSSVKIDARSCSIRQLTPTERKQFFEANHLDGDVKATFAAGLVRDEKIISAISLRKPIHSKHWSNLEVARFCSAIDTTVRGALGRLTKFALAYANSRGINSLLSYVDTRFGSGAGYERCGWKCIGKTPPRFWWTDNVHRYDRFSCRADNKSGMTESQVAAQRGVRKIWGCENLTYQFTNS